MFFINSPLSQFEVTNLIGNLISNVPYSFAVTASGIVSLGLSITIKATLGMRVLIGSSNLWLASFIGLSLCVKYLYGMDSLWWDKFLIGFAFSFVFTIIKNIIMNKENKGNKKDNRTFGYEEAKNNGKSGYCKIY